MRQKILKSVSALLLGINVILPTVISAQTVDLIGIPDINPDVYMQEEPVVMPEVIPEIQQEFVQPTVIQGEDIPLETTVGPIVPVVEEVVSNNTELVEVKGLDEAAQESLGVVPMVFTDADVIYPSAADGISIDRLDAKWVTQATVQNGLLTSKWHGTNDLKDIQLKWDYTLNGVGLLDTGKVQFKIPKTIFTDRSGRPIGNITLSVPSAPSTMNQFNYIETDDAYIIVNTIPLKAGTTGNFYFSIRGLKPSEIKDMVSGYVSNAIQVSMQVLTPSGVEIRRDSNILKANVDTTSGLGSARISTNNGGFVYKQWNNSWPSELKPTNPDNFLYAEFTSYISTYGTQHFHITSSPYVGSKYVGSKVLGVQLNSNKQVIKNEGLVDRPVFNIFSGYLANDVNVYHKIYVAIPKTSVTEKIRHHIGVVLNYEQTLMDEPTVKNKKSVSGSVQFNNDGWVPQGYAIATYKDGQGDRNVYNGRDITGIYEVALNKLSKGESVDVRYRLNNYGWAQSYTLGDGLDSRLEDSYGKKNFLYRITDEKMTANGEVLTNNDYMYNSIVLNKDITELGNDVKIYGKVNNTYIPLVQKVNNVYRATNNAKLQGRVIEFPSNVTGFRVDVLSTRPISYQVTINVRLKGDGSLRSKASALLEGDTLGRIELDNYVESYVSRENHTNQHTFNDVGNNMLDGYTYSPYIRGNLVDYYNDVENRNVILNYEATMMTTTNLSSQGVVDELLNNGLLPKQDEVVWYTLLPLGVVPIRNSVNSNTGGYIKDVEVIENFRGSGRHLLKVVEQTSSNYIKDQTYRDRHQITYSANYSWDNYAQYGTTLNTYTVFESSSDRLASTVGSGGAKDNPVGTQFESVVKGVESVLTDLNPSHNNASFLYSRESKDITVDTYALTSLTKQVDTELEGVYSQGLRGYKRNVFEGSRYNYQLMIRNTDTVKSKGMVFYDNLERYVPASDSEDFNDATWRGKLLGVDTTSLRKLGIKPVIYYSTQSNLVLDNPDSRGHNNLNDRRIWSTVAPSDLSKVTAIAVDASRKEDGSEFILKEDGVMSIVINMVAPNLSKTVANAQQRQLYYDRNSKTEVGFDGGAHAYNNASMVVQLITESGVVGSPVLIKNDYTKVGILPYRYKVYKLWDDDNNRDGKRPAQIEVRLYRDNAPTNEVIILNEANNWEGEFIVPVSDENGRLYHYRVVEAATDGYKARYVNNFSQTRGMDTTIINKHTPELIELKGVKKWENDRESVRPDAVSIKVVGSDGSEHYTTANKEDDWEFSVNGLYKYNNGQEVSYRIEEVNVPRKYTVRYEGNTIINTYNPYGHLQLRKELVGGTSVSSSELFDFQFEFYNNETNQIDSNSYKYRVSDGRTGDIQSGGIIQLKANQTVTISNIEDGIGYTITELEKEGYRIESSSNLKGVIKFNETINATVVNKYSAVGVAQLKARKVLNNRALEPMQFQFGVYDTTGKLVTTTTNMRDGSILFGAIRYTQADHGKTYRYTMREMPATPERQHLGYTLDTHQETVTVSVRDLGKGKLDIRVVYGSSNPTFTNTYTASGDIKFQVAKKMRDGSLPKEGAFRFELRDSSGRVVATATNNKSGLVSFTPIRHDHTSIGKTFTYTAREVNTGDSTIIYDTSTAVFRVTVEDRGDGTLTFRQEAARIPVFTNAYIDGRLSVGKGVVVGDPTHQTFRFRVVLKGSNIPNGTIQLTRTQQDLTVPIVNGKPKTDTTNRYVPIPDDQADAINQAIEAANVEVEEDSYLLTDDLN